MPAHLIAVTGATGELGGRVARRLADAGLPIRLVVRDPARAPQLRGAEIAVAEDYSRTDEMQAALAGASTLFLVSGRESPNRVEQHRSAVDAAVAAGVQRVVYTSFLGAAPDCVFTLGRHHWLTEQHLQASGLRWTALRNSFYLDLLPHFTGEDGVIRGPAGDGAVSAVSRDDVADVALAVLTDGTGQHDGQQYDVTGREALTLAQVAQQITEATGRPVRYEQETEEEAYASRARYGAPDYEVEGWVTSYQAIAAGEVSRVSDTVPRLTGHPAQTLRELLSQGQEQP